MLTKQKFVVARHMQVLTTDPSNQKFRFVCVAVATLCPDMNTYVFLKNKSGTNQEHLFIEGGHLFLCKQNVHNSTAASGVCMRPNLYHISQMFTDKTLLFVTLKQFCKV